MKTQKLLHYDKLAALKMYKTLDSLKILRVRIVAYRTQNNIFSFGLIIVMNYMYLIFFI